MPAKVTDESLVAAQVLLRHRQQLVILSPDPGHLLSPVVSQVQSGRAFIQQRVRLESHQARVMRSSGPSHRMVIRGEKEGIRLPGTHF